MNNTIYTFLIIIICRKLMVKINILVVICLCLHCAEARDEVEGLMPPGEQYFPDFQ